MSTHTVTQVAEYSKPLVVSSQPKPVAGPHQVLVRLLVRPVNPADFLSTLGVYPGFQPATLPATSGLEGCGVVEEVGEGVTLVTKGQRVVPILEAGGSYQEYIVVKETHLISVPNEIPDEVAAQFVINPFTVYGLFRQAKIPTGGYLLQTAAGSEVGRMVIHVAKLKGIKTINLVRRAEQIEELLKEGADHVLCTENNPTLVDEIKKLSGGGVDAIFDCVSGDLATLISGALKKSKPLIVYGGMSMQNPSASTIDLIFKNIRLEGFWIAFLLKELTPEELKEMTNTVIDWMKSGAFATHIGEKFELKDINQAIQASQKPAKPGKVLVYTQL